MHSEAKQTEMMKSGAEKDVYQGHARRWVACAQKPPSSLKCSSKAGSSKKQESSRKTSIDYAKAFDCVDHNKLWEILKEMGIPDHLTCFLRNLYAGQEVTELDMEQQTSSK